MPALGTRAVTRRERRRFVEKEQLGIGIGLHDRAFAAAKFQNTDDPPAHGVSPAEVALFIMEYAAIAQKCAPFGRGDKLAKRCYSVLTWHGLFQFAWVRYREGFRGLARVPLSFRDHASL